MTSTTIRGGSSDGPADESIGPAVRSIGYPSPHFPGPPTVEFDVPETWRPVTPEGYLQFGPKIDMAIVGPDESSGVRPSLMVSVSRTAPTDDPRELLSKVATTYGPETEVRRQSFVEPQQSATVERVGQHICHVASYDEEEDGHVVRRMRCTLYVHGDRMAHVVAVIGSAAVGDNAAFDALAAMLTTLRVSQRPEYRSERVTADG